MPTEFTLNSPLAVKKWSNSLAVEAEDKQYFIKFMGTGDDSLIRVKKELEKEAGDKVTVPLRMKLEGDGVEGDNEIKGTPAEEALSFFSDTLTINQRRKGTKSKGKMSEQRVPFNLRKEGRDALATWYAEDYDQQIMMYIAGARGKNTGFHFAEDWTGRADNPLQAPDSEHIIYGGDATGKADIDADDVMKIESIERLMTKAKLTKPLMLPFNIDGNQKFVLLLHPFQAFSLRNNTSQNEWKDLHKHTDSEKSVLYKDSLGEYQGCILHEHRNVIEFTDYGAGGNLTASRGLFLGAQAGMIAWGGNGGQGRYTWNEETDDRGNALAITAGSIYGIKKARFNSKDFGVIALDTAVKDPTS